MARRFAASPESAFAVFGLQSGRVAIDAFIAPAAPCRTIGWWRHPHVVYQEARNGQDAPV